MGHHRNKERRARDLDLLRQFVEVNGDPVVADAYAEVLRPGDLCIHTPTSATAAARFGKVAGRLLSRDTDVFTGDVVVYLSQCCAHGADVAGGFAKGLSDSIATIARSVACRGARRRRPRHRCSDGRWSPDATGRRRPPS